MKLATPVVLLLLVLQFSAVLCSAQVGAASGEEDPLEAKVKGFFWKGVSKCKHKSTGKVQPVTAKFSGVKKPIMTLKISTNIEGISGFTVDTRTVYYVLNETITINKFYVPQLASDKTDIHIDEAPNYDYGTAPYLSQIEIEFLTEDLLSIRRLPVLCGTVLLTDEKFTPAPTKARNSTSEGGAFNFIKAHIKSLTIYLPIMIAFIFNVLALVWCYCARKSLFGDDEAIDEKLGIVRPGKEKSARLNPDRSPSPEPEGETEEDLKGIPLPTTKTDPSNTAATSSSKVVEEDDLEAFL